jgi:uncharacterized protein YjbJ (UPF0337 family)
LYIATSGVIQVEPVCVAQDETNRVFTRLVHPFAVHRGRCGWWDEFKLLEREKRGHIVSGVDKAKDKAQEVKGRVKVAAGKATDDRSLEAEGKRDKVSGNLKQAGEKVKDAFRRK